MARKREDWRQQCECCSALLPDDADLRKRFCNRKCKSRKDTADRRHERAAARAKLKCQHCGKRIKGSLRARKYCSLTCQERARYWRHVDERRERNRAYSRRRAALLATLLATRSSALAT